MVGMRREGGVNAARAACHGADSDMGLKLHFITNLAGIQSSLSGFRQEVRS